LGGVTRGARGHKSHKVKMSVLEENQAREGTKPPRPVGPGRPTSPLFKHPRCSPSAVKLLILLFVHVLKFVVQNHLRFSHPSRVFFVQQNTS
jgi:hypothetical protein